MSKQENTNDGWGAIVNRFQELYPDQTNPSHYGTLIKYVLEAMTHWELFVKDKISTNT